MILSKVHVAIVIAVAGTLALTLAWEIRAHVQLQAEAARQSAAALAAVTALEKQAAAQSQRAAAAEASVTALLNAARLASAAPAAPPSTLTRIDSDAAAKAVLTRARQLIKEGKPQEALDAYVKCYRELQSVRPGSSACQSLMGAMKNLGRTFPPALAALAELRDAAMLQWQSRPDRRELPFEIALLNENLGEGRRTLAVYDALPPEDPGRQSLAMIARSSFIEAQRYADALLGKPFGQMLATLDAGSRQLPAANASLQPAIRDAVIDQTITNIEVLTGAGKRDEARMLAEKLLAFDNSDATRAALQQHLARAEAPK